VPVYTAPDGPVDETAALENPRFINNDPDAAVPLALLVKQQVEDWYEVYLPLRPNGRTGWVPASSVTTTTHPYKLQVNLSEYRVRLFKEGDEVWATDVAVAAENTPTPGGLYFTTELLAPPDAGGPYGPYAYGLSGFSDVHTTFNGGPGQLGIHGTNQPQYIGQNVSNGCVRMRNEDITYLAESVGLPLGVPVEIVA
jgi:lipoprotein-anchoring transpeptidase ErfK/SrfK